jgi:hypothetical protein
MKRARVVVSHQNMSCPINAFRFAENTFNYNNSCMNSGRKHSNDAEDQTIDTIQALLVTEDRDGKRRKKAKLGNFIFYMLVSHDSNIPLHSARVVKTSSLVH